MQEVVHPLVAVAAGALLWVVVCLRLRGPPPAFTLNQLHRPGALGIYEWCDGFSKA